MSLCTLRSTSCFATCESKKNTFVEKKTAKMFFVVTTLLLIEVPLKRTNAATKRICRACSGFHFHFNGGNERNKQKHWHREIPSSICHNCESKTIIFSLISALKVYSDSRGLCLWGLIYMRIGRGDRNRS